MYDQAVRGSRAVRAYLVGDLYTGALDEEEAAMAYREFTGEDKAEPQAADDLLEVEGIALEDLVEEALADCEEPPFWLAAKTV